MGRPIAYCGDPDSPDLTPAERRRIKRRIANRESARRVRARRQDLIEEMAVKVHAALLPAALFSLRAYLLLTAIMVCRGDCAQCIAAAAGQLLGHLQ